MLHHIVASQHTERWIGAYVLHVRFEHSGSLRIGRKNRPHPVRMDAGHYLYIGSAMGRGSGVYLPKRLVRHATRTGEREPHPCRDALLSHFGVCGLEPEELIARSQKRLFWNIDYVLDHPGAQLQDVLYIRSEMRLEFALAESLESRPDTFAPIPGCGAHDHPGHSHFLRIRLAPEPWPAFCRTLTRYVTEQL